MTPYTTLTVEPGELMIVRLNRPAVRNALNTRMGHELALALNRPRTGYLMWGFRVRGAFARCRCTMARGLRMSAMASGPMTMPINTISTVFCTAQSDGM